MGRSRKDSFVELVDYSGVVNRLLYQAVFLVYWSSGHCVYPVGTAQAMKKVEQHKSGKSEPSSLVDTP